MMPSNAERYEAYTGPRLDIQAQVPKSALSILDVGCSNGELGAALKENAPGRIVQGIENNEVLHAEASSRLDRVYKGDLNRFDWTIINHRFDCILFADVLEHLIEPASTLQQSLKLLKEGGQVIVSLPNIRHISAFWSIYVKGSFPRRNRGIFDETHLRWFTLDDARYLLNSQGLKIIEVDSTLRLQDRPGGKINDFVEKWFEPLKKAPVFNELMSYQFVIKSEL